MRLHLITSNGMEPALGKTKFEAVLKFVTSNISTKSNSIVVEERFDGDVKIEVHSVARHLYNLWLSYHELEVDGIRGPRPMLIQEVKDVLRHYSPYGRIFIDKTKMAGYNVEGYRIKLVDELTSTCRHQILARLHGFGMTMDWYPQVHGKSYGLIRQL